MSSQVGWNIPDQEPPGFGFDSGTPSAMRWAGRREHRIVLSFPSGDGAGGPSTPHTGGRHGPAAPRSLRADVVTADDRRLRIRVLINHEHRAGLVPVGELD